MEDILEFTNEDIGGMILDETFDDVFSTDFSDALPELNLSCKDNLLCVPGDDLSEIDWLSSFEIGPDQDPLPQIAPNEVPNHSPDQISLSSVILQCCIPREDDGPDKVKLYSSNSYSCFSEVPCSRSPTSVLEQSSSLKSSSSPTVVNPHPARPRSKRQRGMSRTWSTNLLSELSPAADDPPPHAPASPERQHSAGDSFSNSDFTSDFSCNSSESGDSSAFNPEICSSAADSVAKRISVKFSGLKPQSPGAKRTRRRRRRSFPSEASVRRCTHCAATKTPQWRAGPNGPKTLCNACGVRFKSGRLLPEYRPAGSPGYVVNKHSNSHRKILEMRKQKAGGPAAPGDEPSASFPSGRFNRAADGSACFQEASGSESVATSSKTGAQPRPVADSDFGRCNESQTCQA